MRKVEVLVFVLFCFSISFAQSGRKLTTAVTPIPVTKVEEEKDYSESRTYKARKIYPRNYGQSKGSIVPTLSPSDVSVDGDVINVDSSIVTIPVSVYDRNGLYIPNIAENEIKVFEDDVEQEIAYFGVSEKPFTVALLIDTSPSTEYKIEQIRAAAKAFVALLKPDDQVIVMEFDGDPQVLSKATTDRRKIYKAIDKADFGNGTALYDAVDYAINKSFEKITGRKAIVLFTDGVDTVSSKSNYDRTLNDAEESETIIFPIYYNTFFENRRSGGVFSSRTPGTGRGVMRTGTSSEEYALGKKYLEELSAYTGGRVFETDETKGGLTGAFENLAEELRKQYNLAYYPMKEGKPGQRKQIKVRIYRKQLIVRARDSYIVGANRKVKESN